MHSDFNILYYVDIYKKSWKTILIPACIAMLLTYCLSLLGPTTYISAATLLKTSGSATGSSDSVLAKFLGISAATSEWGSVASIMGSRRMAKDIREHFKLDEKPKFWWSINRDGIQSGIVEIRGSDPALIQEIVNFCIENLEKINIDLNITAAKPMVRVLDTATYGTPLAKQPLRKTFAVGMLTFLIISAYIFLSDYLKKVKKNNSGKNL